MAGSLKGLPTTPCAGITRAGSSNIPPHSPAKCSTNYTTLPPPLDYTIFETTPSPRGGIIKSKSSKWDSMNSVYLTPTKWTLKIESSGVTLIPSSQQDASHTNNRSNSYSDHLLLEVHTNFSTSENQKYIRHHTELHKKRSHRFSKRQTFLSHRGPLN